MGLLLLKHVFHADLLACLPRILALLGALAKSRTGLEYLETVLRYVVGATDIRSLASLNEVVRATAGEPGGEMMTTLAEGLMDEGRREGLQQGMQQGLTRGAREGLSAGMQLGLELKFGVNGLASLPELRGIEDLETLRAGHDALRTVKALDQLRTVYRQPAPSRDREDGHPCRKR